jgi:GT2 family glycosyltransferase
MSVLILIVSHNNLSLTRRAIASALTQTYPTSLIVLDNASSDRTPQWLAAQHDPKAGWSDILLRDRMSVAGCWNYVLEWAFSPLNNCNYEAVLVLNNDVEIRPDTVELLLRDGSPFCTAVSVRSKEEMEKPEGWGPTSRRPHPDFSCFLIKPIVWKKVGRFDEEFEVAYAEDCDYHVRMHLAGIPACCIDLPFLHHGAQTVKQAEPGEKRMIERAAERNRDRFEEKWGCRPGTPAYESLFQ